MNNTINAVQLSGNLGKAPEYRPHTGSGLATFSLANNRYIPRENGEFEKRTGWFRCVAWGVVAEKVARLEKGARVLVTGRLESREWQDTYGIHHSGIEIVVENIQLLEAIRENGEPEPEESGEAFPEEGEAGDDETAREAAQARDAEEPALPFTEEASPGPRIGGGKGRGKLKA
ncbi:MAG TPA: single-stranded DNA-binding protein [Chloroflexia bacterium]|nr:single-stranded DNA-binding protein [Chloroflexia bacterium]